MRKKATAFDALIRRSPSEFKAKAARTFSQFSVESLLSKEHGAKDIFVFDRPSLFIWARHIVGRIETDDLGDYDDIGYYNARRHQRPRRLGRILYEESFILSPKKLFQVS